MPNAKQWGASPTEWTHFNKTLGLTQHLLPVVSNPSAPISARSKIGDIGKTPTRYNQHHEVVGIGNWTSLRSTASKVDYWSTQPDYGICVQTREPRAMDIDVPDPKLAGKIANFINQCLLLELPKRMRSNSGKCLLLFKLAGEISKRTFPVEGGIVEFLATGQQFIAVGTHPSGVRYEWDGGMPTVVPEITLEEFEAMWSALVDKFAFGPATGGNGGERMRGDHVEVEDPVAEHLYENDLVLDTDRSGNLLVECPWSEDHTSGTPGDSSTLWFKAGTNGYLKGHFDCRHAHCADKTDEDFKDAVGYIEPADSFEAVEYEPGDLGGAGGNGGASGPTAADDEEEPPDLQRRRGMALATLKNVVAAVRKPVFSGMRVRYDEFRDAIVHSKPGCNQYLAFTDNDYTALRLHYEQVHRFKPVSREMVRDAVLLVAKQDRFDTAVEWLNQRQWDGVERVETFLTKYFGVADSAYSRAVSRYIWTALAGRTLDPGCKADMVPILVGGQGARKSSAVAAMVVSHDFFTELQLDSKEDDMSRKMRGCQIAELSELQGLHTKALESIKAFVTRTHESWVPKYQEFSTRFPRRLIFIGTTNQDEFLADETGNRRWLPVTVGGHIDVEAIRDDCLQLWAEAAELHMLNGVEYQKAEELAVHVHAQHMITDGWQSIVEKWLDTKDEYSGEIPRTREFLQIANVLQDAILLQPKAIVRFHEMRMGKVLQALGYKRVRQTIDGKRRWVYANCPTEGPHAWR